LVEKISESSQGMVSGLRRSPGHTRPLSLCGYTRSVSWIDGSK
jgi:hypothetical protein